MPAARATAFIVLALAMAGCGTSSVLDKVNIFADKKTSTMTASDKNGATIADTDDIECPGVAVRTGASTLSIGTKPSQEEPSALDLRYQGTILRTARECHVSAGFMTMKVGIEGRIITGPAGGPGNVDVPLRIAVVHEGPVPKPIVSKFASVPVTVANAVDRVNFTHVENDVTFPMPVPAGDIDAYVVYVGFDPLGAQPKKPEKKPAVKRKPATKPAATKPKQG
ncbi:MAG TPA: hypothetical protein VFC54_08835 [Pseudolabrys sp.]|nr:hypothetical protein [Pseudolabrys sp.]